MKIVTANTLKSGRVVYLTKAGDWSAHIKEALVLADEEADAALQSAQARTLEIADVYLIDATEAAAPTGRARFREEIRSGGPTIEETSSLTTIGA